MTKTSVFRRSCTLMALVWAASVIWGCALTGRTPLRRTAAAKQSRLLVLPFTDMSAIYGSDATVRGPATSQVFVTGEVAQDAPSELDVSLQKHLARHSALKWDGAGTGAAVFDSIEMTDRISHIRAIARIGFQKGSDVVLSGYLYAFEKRRGGDYGAERPASVAMELVLVQVDPAQLIWQGRHIERQQPLSTNLMTFGQFVERKGRWVTALEMADTAISKMLPGILNALPY